MTKTDFVEWKNHPVTQLAMESIAEAAGDVVAAMINSRDSSDLNDQYNRGYIRGVQAFMEWDPDLDEYEV